MKEPAFDSTPEFQHFKKVMRGVLAVPKARVEELVEQAKVVSNSKKVSSPPTFTSYPLQTFKKHKKGKLAGKEPKTVAVQQLKEAHMHGLVKSSLSSKLKTSHLVSRDDL